MGYQPMKSLESNHGLVARATIMNDPRSISRRAALRSLVSGSLMMPAILSELSRAGAAPLATGNSPLATPSADPLAPKLPHFAAKAKRVIFLFMTGGVSHVDSFDYKPKLIADAGKSIKNNYLKAPSFDFSP